MLFLLNLGRNWASRQTKLFYIYLNPIFTYKDTCIIIVIYIPTTCDDGFSAVCVVVLGCEELAGAAAVSVTGSV